MGKIRVSTLGSEEAEKKQKQKAEKRKQAKQQSKAPEIVETVSVVEEKKADKKKSYAKKDEKKSHKQSKRWKTTAKLVDRSKTYSLSQAIDLLEQMNTLPHGSGKQTRVAIIAPSKDTQGAEDLLSQIAKGQITFDILVATPDAMPKLARVAKILGPRGLMPNPKAGTITTKPEEVAKKYEGGQMNFKTEAKLPLLHLSVGKVSFGKQKLEENIKTAIQAIQAKNIKNATIKSTMSAGIKIQVA